MWTWLVAAALAADDPSVGQPPSTPSTPSTPSGPWWAGEWGLDPSRSDDPTAVIERAYVTPAMGVTDPRRMAPDNGMTSETESEQDRQKAIYETLDLLGRSGRVSLGSAEGGVSLGWGDGQNTVVGSRWVKLVDDEGEKYRIRVGVDDEVLVIERRFKSTVLLESWLAPQEGGDARSRVVVVQVESPTLAEAVEFRRIYRRLE